MTRKTVAAVTIAAALGALAGSGATVWYLGQKRTTDDATLAAPAVASPAAPPPSQLGPPLVVGDYTFDVVGGQKTPVRLDDCGPDCLTLVSTPTGSNVNGFSQVLTKQGDQYSGQGRSDAGVACASDGRPRPADVRYSVRADGTNGRVEVLGRPCGAEEPNVPLAFTLVKTPVGGPK